MCDGPPPKYNVEQGRLSVGRWFHNAVEDLGKLGGELRFIVTMDTGEQYSLAMVAYVDDELENLRRGHDLIGALASSMRRLAEKVKK